MDFPSITFAVAAILFLWSPQYRNLTLKPWHVGILASSILLLSGHLSFTAASSTLLQLSPALISILSLMFLSWVVSASGLLEQCLHTLLHRDGICAVKVFNAAYLMSALTSALLSNDLAILILTPAILHYAKQHFPSNGKVAFALALAVFTAAGVAPLPTSNPMNLVFVSQLHIPIIDYATYMLPASVAVWAISYLALRLMFRKVLRQTAEHSLVPDQFNTHQFTLLGIITLQTLAYIFATPYGLPIWLICITGALLSYLVYIRNLHIRELPKSIDWDSLLFLAFIYMFAAGLQGSDITQLLKNLYANESLFTTAWVSALGSAIINNHPMASLNLSALIDLNASQETVLAALIGGDIGPRMLYTGSLAGVLWFGILRKEGVRASIRIFSVIGLATTIPAIFSAIGIMYFLR